MNGGLVIVETDTYNFGNEVTSVSLPTWSQQIGYNYDASGRLQTVTASGFNTWTYNWQTQRTTYYPLANFATDITHRASGALKHLTYGNAAELNLQYNERQLPSTSQLTNVVDDSQTTFPRTFDYYPDGRVHHAYDPNRNIFDRAYDYDNAGRLKEAYSGSQARGGTTNDGPYRQSYGYNAFGTSPSGRTICGGTRSRAMQPHIRTTAAQAARRRLKYIAAGVCLLIAVLGCLVFVYRHSLRSYRQVLFVTAASQGRVFRMRVLLLVGASVNEPACAAPRCLKPIIAAAWFGDEGAVRLLLESGADIRSTTQGGDSVLLFPALRGDTNRVRYLLSNGADPNIANFEGNTPLEGAIKNYHSDTAEVLIEAGAKQ